jgi:hypothetical protein
MRQTPGLPPAAVHLTLFAVLLGAYAAWLVAFWPGFFGQDSLALALQVESEGARSSGKSLFWYLFGVLTYGPRRLVEWPIACQLLFAAGVFTRILGWCWAQGMKKTFAFLLAFIALSPATMYYQGLLYPDGPYSVAAAGLCFEAWKVAHERRLTRFSFAWLLVLAPVAFFFRDNGIYLTVLLVPAFLAVGRMDRVKIASVLVLWVGVQAVGARMVGPIQSPGVLFPLSVFETVNFVQPIASATGLYNAQHFLTAPTVEALNSHRPIREIAAYHDRDYWDTLVYLRSGPQLGALGQAQRDVILREFLCCNLWNNFPAFAASRVNVFLVSALGKGWFTRPEAILETLPQTKSASQIRPYADTLAARVGRAVHERSFKYRWLLWSPLPGLVLVLALLVRGWRRRDKTLLLIAAPFIVQAGGIFLFSIAGEHRYLLLFFTGTAALLPIWVASRRAGPVRGQP